MNGNRPASIFSIMMVIATVFLLAAGLSGCASTQTSKQSLKVGLIPNQSPDQVQVQYELFRLYLEQKLAMPVELFVPTDYTAVVEAMANDKLDVAYFGGLTYVQAKQRANIYPIVTELDRYTHTTKYHSLIIVPADSAVQQVAELRNQNFAFGDVSSTSGSLYPRIMLDQAGITVPGDLNRVIYTGGHDATALAVQNGTVDAGGIEDRILYALQDKGVVDQRKIRILAQSEPIEGYPWVVRASMEASVVQQLIQAFLAMNDPELLKLMRAEGYARVNEADYSYVEAEAIRLGLIKQ